MNQKIVFPALVIQKTFIDLINYRYLVGDKRYLSQGFKNVLIVDRLGNCFDTKGVRQIGGLSLFYSIKLVGLMVRTEPILNKPVYKMSIDELRRLLIIVIEGSRRKFTPYGGAENLIEELNNCSTYTEIFKAFGG